MQLREVSFAELNFEILQHVLKKKKKLYPNLEWKRKQKQNNNIITLIVSCKDPVYRLTV